MSKKLRILLMFVTLSLSFTGCFSEKVTKDITESSSSTIQKSVSAVSLVTSFYPSASAQNIDTGSRISIVFDRDINASTVNSSSVKLQNHLTQVFIDGKITVTGGKIEFIPITKFKMTNDKTTIVSGLKPSTKYNVIFSSGIKDIYGNSISSKDITWEFTTSDINYGLYWFDSNGEAEKYIPGQSNRFYNSSKPVMIYAHGWQSGTTKNDYWIEQPYIINDKYSSFNSAEKWNAKGYNMGAFVWGQLADESEVKDAEAKIWVGANGLKNMRYMIGDGTYKNFSTSKSVGELLYGIYKTALSGNTSNNIRFAGHSLGNQVVTKITECIMNDVESKIISSSLMPKRIALLDPFWSKDSKSYLNGKWTGEKSREIISKAISKYQVAVEQYKTTAIGGLVTGDENLDMRKMTAFYRIWPDFIPLTEAGTQHSYAYVWYFDSIAYNINISNGVVGAASGISALKGIMNYGKSSYYYYYNTGAGTKTSTSYDDTFIRGNGVSTW